MNSLEARRALLADPRRATPELEEAIRLDAQLASLRQQLLAANDQLSRAFAEVIPPSGLADRIILRARYRTRSRLLAGIAATVLVAVVSVTMLGRDTVSPISVAMLDHVVENPDELKDDGQVPVQKVKASLAQLDVGFADLGYRVRHLSECEVAGRIGRHLVMDTPEGQVSFLILPKRLGELAGRELLRKGGFQAVLRPSDQVAIGAFGDRNMDAAKLEAMMQRVLLSQRAEA